MFELIVALLLASLCPSPKTVNSHSQSFKHQIAVVDTAGDHGHIPPDPFIRKRLPGLQTVTALVDTAGDHGHIPPNPFGRKYVPIPRIVSAVIDTAGDHGHIPPDIFGRKRIIKA